MKKSFKTIVSVILAIIMIMSVMITPMAANTTKDASGGDVASMFDIEIKTNKSSYGVQGVAKITVKVTNITANTIYNVGAEAIIDQLDPCSRNSDVYAEDSELEPGETMSFTYKATLDADAVGLDGWNSFWLNFKRFFQGSCNSEAPDFNDGRAYEIASKEISFGKYDVEQIVKVWYVDGLGLTIDQNDYTTTDINAHISGQVFADSGIDSVTYTSTAEADQGVPGTIGNAVIDGNIWTISFNLKTGVNTVVVTAKTVDNRTTSEIINITYDIGEISTPTIDDYVSNNDFTYRKGVLIVYFEEWVTDEEAKTIISEFGGTVIGQNNFLKLYEVEFEISEYSSLSEKAEEMENHSDIMLVNFDELSSIEYVYISDPWDGDVNNADWNNSDVDGSNWGLEAIDIASVWEHNDRFAAQPSRIGVVDSDFLLTHDDFDNDSDNINWFRVNSNGSNYMLSDHGTHVAGTIAASENNYGITGIVQNTNMYVAEAGISDRGLGTTLITDGFARAVINGAKVVNFSLGRTTADTNRARDSAARDIVPTMVRLLDEGFDFLCVQSAGNSGDINDENLEADANGWFCALYPEMDISYCTTRYNAQDLIDRTIIVGSADNTMTNYGYELSFYSNYGDKVDIVAPGDEIYSSIAGVTNGREHGYKSGTSMAAPHVTAVAGLVWSINHEFTMAEVKEIVCSDDCTTEVYDSERATHYRMLNAGMAVEKAIELTDAHGTVYGTIVDAATGYSITSGSFSVYKENANGEVVFYSSYSDGDMSFSVPAGTYVIEISADGNYVTKYLTVEVVANDTVYCGSIPMSENLDDNQMRIVLSWGANPYDLDSHINGYLIDGNQFHVYYSNRSCYYNSETAVWLDVDDVDSYGPETITIIDLDQVDNFKYSIHNYSGRYAESEDAEAFDLSDSGAVISVYKGNTLVATYNVPTNRKGTVWDVFSVDSYGRITTINTIYYESDPYLVGNY